MDNYRADMGFAMLVVYMIVSIGSIISKVPTPYDTTMRDVVWGFSWPVVLLLWMVYITIKAVKLFFSIVYEKFQEIAQAVRD